MATFYVEFYGGDGSWADLGLQEWPTLDEALSDAAGRLMRPVDMPGDWVPDADMSRAVPEGAKPVGAWHESDKEGCGGVAIWRKD